MLSIAELEAAANAADKWPKGTPSDVWAVPDVPDKRGVFDPSYAIIVTKRGGYRG